MAGIPITVIAEAGVNHNGSLDMAIALVDAAAAAGADVVKFQTFKADRMITRHAPKAGYQVETTGGDENQLDMVRRLELSEDMHHSLLARCREKQIEFLSTPFDIDSARFLTSLGLRRLKVPSGEITNGPLLLYLARTGLPLIVSTGMATLDEVEAALAMLAFGYSAADDAVPDDAGLQAAYADPAARAALKEKLVLLHCTTAYPAPMETVNLRAMDTMAVRFGLPVGYSDHTVGITVPVAAAAREAVVIEKHFTLDRSLPGPDHRASLEPDELAAMVEGIRQVEAALGNGAKEPHDIEIANAAVARKSLVAARDIRRGDVIDADSLVAMRPGTGVSPMRYWQVRGRRADRDYRAGDLIAAE
jgi:N-acetylneuraminate synthase